MSPDDPRHGTTAGMSAHRTADETPCDACREAWNAYMRQRRSEPEFGRRQIASSRARGRALARLARTYSKDYQAMYAEELASARRAR